MMLRGERVAALAGRAVGTAGLFSLGLVGDATSVLDPVNPLRLLELTGINLGKRLRTASLLVVPLSFGVALATTSVQTYVNRRAPLRYQGRIFAVESSLRNGSAIVPLLALGAAASQFGADKVLLASPFLLLVVGLMLVQMSFRFAERAPPSYLEALESFWERAEPKQEET